MIQTIRTIQRFNMLNEEDGDDYREKRRVEEVCTVFTGLCVYK